MYKKEHHLEVLQFIINESGLLTFCPLDEITWALLEVYGIGWEQGNV